MTPNFRISVLQGREHVSSRIDRAMAIGAGSYVLDLGGREPTPAEAAVALDAMAASEAHI